MAVIGAGWIGAEVAASARQKGLEVTLIEQLDVPLERVLGREVGEVYGAIHRDQGVELLTGTASRRSRDPAAPSASGWPAAVPSTATSSWSASASRRARRWPRPAGLETGDGINVDERLRTSE